MKLRKKRTERQSYKRKRRYRGKTQENKGRKDKVIKGKEGTEKKRRKEKTEKQSYKNKRRYRGKFAEPCQKASFHCRDSA
ncbi:MAG: hypothetical protein LBT40_05955 [Deltaproteobacteria bacterium]|nr:hypothetical protein [Deltaproteobacteria bacterium]